MAQEQTLQKFDVEVRKGSKVDVVEIEAADEAAAREAVADRYGDDAEILTIEKS